jgi:uncharacterized phage-like protein YoqJ
MRVAGTGHRPDKLGGYSKSVKAKLEVLALDWLTVHKPSLVISGMALGWDQALAVAALECKIPLLAAVPFEGQELAWPQSSQEEYQELLKLASEIRVVSPGGYAAYKMQRRNEWMIDHCDYVLALWDGSSGGTANCIKYAKQQIKTIENLWNQWSK